MANLFRSSLLLKPPLLRVNANRGLKSHCLEIGAGRRVAYRLIPGQRSPTVVFVPGLHSYAHMNGMMARSVMRFCDVNRLGCVAYDHECMGESRALMDDQDRDIRKLLFSHWVEDLTRVVHELVGDREPVLLVSLSMGCWLSLVAAQSEELADRVHGLVLFAPALNYVYPYYKRHRDTLSGDTRKRLDSGDIHMYRHALGDALLKRDFADDSRRYEIDLNSDTVVDIRCPVRIIHGLEDKEVSYEESVKLTRRIASPNVDLILRKMSPHQAVDLREAGLVIATLDRFIKDHPVQSNA